MVVFSRANNSHAWSGKPDQLTPEALPTHILWFLSLFTTSVMVKWQNIIFYNTFNIWHTAKRNLLLEWYKKSVICWSSQVKIQSNLLPRGCWLLETFWTFFQVPSCNTKLFLPFLLLSVSQGYQKKSEKLHDLWNLCEILTILHNQVRIFCIGSIHAFQIQLNQIMSKH